MFTWYEMIMAFLFVALRIQARPRRSCRTQACQWFQVTTEKSRTTRSSRNKRRRLVIRSWSKLCSAEEERFEAFFHPVFFFLPFWKKIMYIVLYKSWWIPWVPRTSFCLIFEELVQDSNGTSHVHPCTHVRTRSSFFVPRFSPLQCGFWNHVIRFRFPGIIGVAPSQVSKDVG